MHGDLREALGKCGGVEEDIGLQLGCYLGAVDVLERSARRRRGAEEGYYDGV